MASLGAQKVPKSEKLDEAQALARSCAGRPDFLPCDGLSMCATHSHGKCFKLHWCCHLGWCHCRSFLACTVLCLICPEEFMKCIYSTKCKSACKDHEYAFCVPRLHVMECAVPVKFPSCMHFALRYLAICYPLGPVFGLLLVSCKYVYQPMTPVGQLPSTSVPATPTDLTDTMDIAVSLTERFLKTASFFQPPPCPESPKYCLISDLFIDNYQVKRINGKMCYVQRPPPPPPPLTPQPQNQDVRWAANCKQAVPGSASGNGANEKVSVPKMDHCSSPSSSEDSGINALGLHYMESCDENSEDEDDLSSDEDSSPGSIWDQDECSLLSPSKSTVEIIENIETTV
ncbi:CC70A protein, partial [Polyodon spathula]|nr:CC70A protein [Polyodon spathula]